MKRMLTALLLLAPLVGPTALDAAELRSYTVRLEATESGASRGSLTVEVTGADEGRFAIPLGLRAEQVELVEGPAGTTVRAERLNGQLLAKVALPDSAGGAATIRLRFSVSGLFEEPTPAAGEKRTLPIGHRLFRHTLVNTQPAPIRRYRFELVFPAGIRAHAIREALPKLRKAEVGPRVQFDGLDSQAGARLQVDGLAQGDTASMQIELMPASRSLGWLIAGLVLSVLYLVYFRDLVARDVPQARV